MSRISDETSINHAECVYIKLLGFSTCQKMLTYNHISTYDLEPGTILELRIPVGLKSREIQSGCPKSS